MVLDSQKETTKICEELSRVKGARGCLIRWQETYWVFCPQGPNMAECIAHEIRHIVEPEWRHK